MSGFNAEWQALFRKVQDGDQLAYRELIDGIRPLLMGFLRKQVSDSSKVDDVYQNVLLKMHVSRHTFDSSKPLEPWLFTVARSVLATFFKKEGRYKEAILLVDDPPREYGEVGSQEVVLSVKEAVNKLTDKQKKAMELTGLEGLSMEDGAKKTGSSVTAFKVMAHRAKKAMVEELTEDPGEKRKKAK